MVLRACALALWCAAMVARAAAYTVDCNHEYTDCDTELSKLAIEDEDIPSLLLAPTTTTARPTKTTTKTPIIVTTPNIETTTEEIEVTTTSTPSPIREFPETKPKGRLLNLNVEDLQSFANSLHNQTKEINLNKSLSDLSDVNLDDDEEEPPRMVVAEKHDHNKHISDIRSDKFYSNLQAPFSPLLTMTGSEEIDTCKENGITYKIGERMDRGCEETCECTPGGSFDCTPRCKHPYIRRGRRLNDPLCFESPVDECCSIIACATGNGEVKPSKVEVCRYGNDTYPVGGKWNVGCEQKCTCDPNSVVTCKPRCSPLPPSDKCINVQDPNDACCEVQICDVSQDVHEEPIDNTTTTTSTTTTESIKGFEDYSDIFKSTMRPLVLTEPIGSIKVLQNNSVQVNLMQLNTSEDPIHLLLSDDGGKRFEDVELKYSNLILNLPGGKDYILKTKETGTKFNFTITSLDENAEDDTNGTEKVGCYRDGKFYAVGEEFHIGCTKLCECTGPDKQECVDLVCPSHVGLELVSKGCVRWAPSPPPQPPNCCPRAARCLSDGTCHYKGIAVPNWSEVPISLTGCELRCFCENGELDCQEVCTPLPTVPPQTLRCPPMHRPAPVNISDDDCCKQWGCVPSAEDAMEPTLPTYLPTYDDTPVVNYVTPVPSIASTTTASTVPPPVTHDSPDPTEFFKHLHPVKSYPKIIKTVLPLTGFTDPQKYSIDKPPNQEHVQGDNITVFTLDDIEYPFKTIHADHSLTSHQQNWQIPAQNKEAPKSTDFKIISSKPSLNYADNWRSPYQNNKVQMSSDPFNSLSAYPKRPSNLILSHDAMHELIDPKHNMPFQINLLNQPEVTTKHYQEPLKRVPMSKVENINFFLPAYNTKAMPRQQFGTQNSNQPFQPSNDPFNLVLETLLDNQKYFAPVLQNSSMIYIPPTVSQNSNSYSSQPRNYKAQDVELYGNHLKTYKDIKMAKSTNSIFSQESKSHLLRKAPSPYETVLLRPVPTPINSNHNMKVTPIHSPLDLEHLVSQMELESEVNRNLERSADKISKGAAAGKTPPPDLSTNPPRPQPPPFLPTIPPEIHFPQDDLPDYGHNVHRPVNSLEPNLPGLPPGLPIPMNYGDDNKKLSVLSLVADSPTSVKLLFGLPPVLVGLRGSVDLRYTDKDDEDISHWYSQVFAPADEVLTTPRLEFRLTGLKPSTAYKIRGKLYLHNLPVEPESEIYSVRTLDLPTVVPMEEKRREIDSRLTVIDVNDTAAHVSWRHFTENELQFIDGIQVRYRPVGTPIYSMTELLHHSRSLAELHDLRPGSRYEASLVLVPPPRATTELYDPGKVEFTTSPYIDPYNWTVTIETKVVGSEAAELTWRGVPSPAERWVRIYRAAHACGDTRREHDAFRLAARDLPPTILMTGLESDTRCRVWLELFLTNGKIKTSNVLEINTKSQDTPLDIDNEIEASSIAGSRGSPRGDYYGALVVVGVVAALGALTSLLLLLVLVRRHRPRSVPITPVPSAPRESSLPPYDNPAYKLELQQETMDL